MAIAGRFGTLELKREWGTPTAVSTKAISGSDAITLENQCFWRGDRVLMMSQRGMPFRQDGEAYARCPDGYSFYDDGVFATGPAVEARTIGGAFYATADSAAFYETDLVNDTDSYVFMARDEMDDVQFYASEIDAWGGELSTRLIVDNVDFGSLLFVPAPSGAYASELVAQGVAALPPDIADDGEITIDEFWPVETRNQIRNTLHDLTEASDWKCVSSLTDWVFEMNVGMLDQTAIGERFGAQAKGLLNGAGSLNAVMDASARTGSFDSSSLLKFALMTEEGSKAQAKFQIAGEQNGTAADCQKSPGLHYLVDLLVSKSSVNISVTDAIRTSIEFVSTGTCKIGVG